MYRHLVLGTQSSAVRLLTKHLCVHYKLSDSLLHFVNDGHRKFGIEDAVLHFQISLIYMPLAAFYFDSAPWMNPITQLGSSHWRYQRVIR